MLRIIRSARAKVLADRSWRARLAAGKKAFIKRRKGRQAREKIKHLSAGVKFWLINYAKVAPVKAPCKVWDFSKFKLVDKTYLKAVDPFGKKNSPFYSLNKIFAKYANINIAGKLVFSYFLRSFYKAIATGKSAPFIEKLGVNKLDASSSLYNAYTRFRDGLLRERRSFNRELDLSYLTAAGIMSIHTRVSGHPYHKPDQIARPHWIRFISSRDWKARNDFFLRWGVRPERYKIIKPFLRDRRVTLGENTPRNFCIASEKSPSNFSSFYPGNKGALVRLLDSFLTINNILMTPVDLAVIKNNFDKAYAVYKYLKLLRVTARRTHFYRSGFAFKRGYRFDFKRGKGKLNPRRWYLSKRLKRRTRSFLSIIFDRRALPKRFYSPRPRPNPRQSFLLQNSKRRYAGRSLSLKKRPLGLSRAPTPASSIKTRPTRVKAPQPPLLSKKQFFYFLKSTKPRSFLSTGRFKTYPGFFYYFSLVRTLQRRIRAFDSRSWFGASKSFNKKHSNSFLENLRLANEFKFKLQMK